MQYNLRFNHQYKEHIQLPSGKHVRLRLIRADDKPHISKAFAGLSLASRHKRFFGAKKKLSELELRYFTEIDQYNHFALCALEVDDSNIEVGIAGVTRFIRLASDAECAEVGISVIDSAQGNGIGRHLMERLLMAATERGIRRLHFECLSENMEIQHLVRKLNQHVTFIREHGLIIAQIEIPEQYIVTNQYPLDLIEDFSALIRGFSSEAFILYTDLSFKMIRHGLFTANNYTKMCDNKLIELSRSDTVS